MQYITLAALLLISISSTSVFAKTYYVKNDGNDNANGTSDATAWKTINKVNAFKFATGDDVYFKAGHQWKRQEFVIDWAGTSRNRAIIGSYYMKNGTEQIGVPSGTSKPIISGGYTSAKSIGNVPAGTFRGLVWVNSKSYVTIQNLMVKDSSGYGITTSGGVHNIIEDNIVNRTAGASYFAFPGSDYIIFRKNLAIRGAWSINDKIKPTEYGSRPPCMGIKDSKNGIAENNELYQLHCEGISIVLNSTNAKVRNNTISNGKHVGIYIDGSSNAIVESNMILGNGSGKTVNMTGIAVAVERQTKAYNAKNNIIRNNLIAGVSLCFYSELFKVARDLGRFTSGKFIGNTCVGTDDTISFFQGAPDYSTWEVANNVFWDTANGANACRAPKDSDITFRHNSWGTHPKDPDCSGSGDTYGNPTLNSLKNFRSFNFSNKATHHDFAPVSSSHVIGAGIASPALKEDYTGQPRTSNPTIGAIEGTTATTVKPPNGLSISISSSL